MKTKLKTLALENNPRSHWKDIMKSKFSILDLKRDKQISIRIPKALQDALLEEFQEAKTKHNLYFSEFVILRLMKLI